MKEDHFSSARVTQSLLPALRTYSSGGVAIIGCHSRRSSRNSCEYDLMIVSEDLLPPKSLRVKDLYVDILFKTEREVRRPLDPEFAVVLSSLVPIRDSSLLLAASASDCKKAFAENCARASELRLGSALKALGRVDGNTSSGNIPDADFWLLSAGYDFCHATLYSNGTVPSPSHLLTQMKGVSKKPGSHFKEWADSVGLPLASRASCENRLGGLSVLYDVLRTVEPIPPLTVRLGRYRSKESEEILRRKTTYLIDLLLSAECFAFLGYESMKTLLDLLEYQAAKLGVSPSYQSIVEALTRGKDRLIADEMIRSLGLVRTKELILSSSESLRGAIAKQAKSG